MSKIKVHGVGPGDTRVRDARMALSKAIARVDRLVARARKGSLQDKGMVKQACDDLASQIRILDGRIKNAEAGMDIY